MSQNMFRGTTETPLIKRQYNSWGTQQDNYAYVT